LRNGVEFTITAKAMNRAKKQPAKLHITDKIFTLAKCIMSVESIRKFAAERWLNIHAVKQIRARKKPAGAM
jgi:hypothetical protein